MRAARVVKRERPFVEHQPEGEVPGAICQLIEPVYPRLTVLCNETV